LREGGCQLNGSLAEAILTAVDVLVDENSIGRRPWPGEWETYFEKCMINAFRLLKEFSSFTDYPRYCRAGYCNRFLDAFAHMDYHDRHYAEDYPDKRVGLRWARHFARLAAMAANMFCLVADSEARIDKGFLDHPDDAVFSSLLTGYANSSREEAKSILVEFTKDEESWVRDLARDLLIQFFPVQ